MKHGTLRSLGVVTNKVAPNKLDMFYSFHQGSFQIQAGYAQIQLSRGDICVATFIPPVNGASQGDYCLGC